MIASAPVWRDVLGRVARQQDRGAGHMWLEVEVADTFEPPVPGQFVQLRMLETSAAFLPRPMSVASVARVEGGLRLGFLFVPVGAGTAALAALPAGAQLGLLGPLGRGFPLDTPGVPVLVAGGRGVAPLLFAAERLQRMGRACTFLFGARSRAYLVELDEVRRRVEGAGGRVDVCTDDGSAGRAGDVVELLEHVGAARQRIVIHACGPHPMLHAVARWSADAGADAFVAMESHMACGTGVCRGCPLPRSARARAAYGARVPSLYGNREFAMCCTDGPVFEAGDLDWERIE